MTTPPAQDGERERLVCHRCGGNLAGDSLDVCELCACKIELESQSAELAALRAQVEGLQPVAWQWRCRDYVGAYGAWKECDEHAFRHQVPGNEYRALCVAPPQPAAKEK